MRSDARKRHNPEPLPHWDAEVCRLLDEARAQGRIEGWNARGEAMREDARRAALDAYKAKKDDERRASEVTS